MRLTESQIATLRAWETGAWSAGPYGGWVWEGNILALSDAGLLEACGEDDCLFRITDIGRQALKQKDKSDDR